MGGRLIGLGRVFSIATFLDLCEVGKWQGSTIHAITLNLRIMHTSQQWHTCSLLDMTIEAIFMSTRVQSFSHIRSIAESVKAVFVTYASQPIIVRKH